MKIVIAVLLFAASVALGGPPFNYPSAVSYADETVTTKVPKNERIYLFGPEEITETYTLNGVPTKRIVPMRRIFSHVGVDSVASLWKTLELDLKGQWILSVYRAKNPTEPPSLEL